MQRNGECLTTDKRALSGALVCLVSATLGGSAPARGSAHADAKSESRAPRVEARVRPDSIAAHGTSYEVALLLEQRDYYLASPTAPGAFGIRTSAALPQVKSKMVFDQPLKPGAYTLQLSDDASGNDRTRVLSVPLVPGKYEFTVSAQGRARYDLAFHDDGPKKEYRFTIEAPSTGRVFHLDMPSKS